MSKKNRLWRKFRGISDPDLLSALQNFNVTVNQHALVINAQRDKIALQELRIGLLEEKVYASLTPEERERLNDIIESALTAAAPQPEPFVPEPGPIEGTVIEAEIMDEQPVITDHAQIEEALRGTVPAHGEVTEQQPAA